MADGRRDADGETRATGGAADDGNAEASTDANAGESGDESVTDPLADRGDLAPLSLDEALSVIGEETRARIIVELGKAWNDEAARPATLSYSELMERVGAEDSGRFNYHLDKLVGTFVEKREEGYVLGQPGRLVHRTIVAGTLTDRESVDPFPVADCTECDGQFTATYRPDHILLFSCPDCGEKADAIYLPARGFENRRPDEAVDAALQRTFSELGLLRRGVCYGCSGRVERDLRTTVGDLIEDRFEFDVFATVACRSCNESFIAHPARVAITAPVVVGFFADHDRDAALTRPWDPVFDAADEAMTVTDDPVRAEAPFELGDERLTVTLDDDLAVVDAERTTVE